MDVITELDLPTDPASAVERDFQLLDTLAHAPTPAPVLRIWKNAQCLVVGGQIRRMPEYDAACSRMKPAGWPVVERSTGGTVVAHYSGVINISLIAPVLQETRDLKSGYMLLNTPIINALAKQDITATTGAVNGAYCDGPDNVVANHRKLAGTAQRWKRHQAGGVGHVLLAHASLNIADAGTGVQAVNTFYQAARTTQSFDAGQHTDCTAINPAFDITDFVTRNLPDAFSAALG